MTYTVVGPFTNGGPPGLSATFFNGLETWIETVDNSTAVVLNGSTTGTATLYQVFSGTFKLVIVQMTNFRNGSAPAQTIAIPTPFTKAVRGWNSGCGSFQVLLSSAVQTVQQLSVLNAGADNTTSGQSTIKQNWLWHNDAGIDTISFNGSDAGTHTAGQIIMFGI